MNLLDVLDFRVTESMNQSNTLTRNQTRYDITIKRTDNGEVVTLEYQCNPKYTKPNLKDCLYCYLNDATAYEYCDDDIDIFNDALGFDSVKACIKAFKDCKKAYVNLKRLCGSDGVYEWLKEYYEDY